MQSDFWCRLVRHDILLSTLVLQSPYWLASLMTFVLLVRDKPYLIRGRPIAIWLVVRQGTILSVADGFLFATLSLTRSGVDANIGASDNRSMVCDDHSSSVSDPPRAGHPGNATVVRRLHPYLVERQVSCTAAQAFAKITLAIGVGYGAIVALRVVCRIPSLCWLVAPASCVGWGASLLHVRRNHRLQGLLDHCLRGAR